MGLRKHLNQRGTIRLGIGALKVPFSAKMTKMPLVNPRLAKSQTKSKSSQNNIFHGFTSNLSYSETFVNFDWVWLSLTQSWPLVGPKNPNFDLTIKTGLDHCHCGDYQIENYAKRINTLLEATTFDPTVGFLISLVLGKLDIHRFLGTQRLAQFDSEKIFKYSIKVKTEKLEKEKTIDVNRTQPGAHTVAIDPTRHTYSGH